MTAFWWEREEHRCAVEAAEDAGELDTYWWDRPDYLPTRYGGWGGSYDEEFDEGDADEPDR